MQHTDDIAASDFFVAWRPPERGLDLRFVFGGAPDLFFDMQWHLFFEIPRYPRQECTMSHGHEEGLEEIESAVLHNMLQVLFGDTAVYIAPDVEAMPERRRANAVRIVRTALRVLGDRVSDEGCIPPRVAGMFLNAGTFCEDAVISAYWGGILASSRGAHRRDDRAVRWLNVISRLGEYELRSHYLFYSSLRLLLMNYREPGKIDFGADRFQFATFIPTYFYMVAMGFEESEVERMPRIISSILYGMGQELLVDGSNSGSDHFLKKHFKTNVTNVIKGEGIVFTPSVLGLRLFLWVFGFRDADERFILDPRLDCRVDGVPLGVEHSGLVYKG